MRERWFGATGLRVPEIAVEGELELGDALVLDDVSDEAALKQAHEQGRRSSCGPSSAEEVKAALAGPRSRRCSSPPTKRELLELDLTELTYG